MLDSMRYVLLLGYWPVTPHWLVYVAAAEEEVVVVEEVDVMVEDVMVDDVVGSDEVKGIDDEVEELSDEKLEDVGYTDELEELEKEL